ncbi:hypothetical protein C1I97_25205 [Streptomyces sp. NTH33]|nr:hypothetical protein C1I97_25205 [Streptomyces sp. NTH33]
MVIKASRHGATFVLSDQLFDEEQAAALTAAANTWVCAVDVWQLWNGEIVDLSMVGSEPSVLAQEPVR